MTTMISWTVANSRKLARSERKRRLGPLGILTHLALLIWTRARAERNLQQVRSLELDAAERGLLEGS